MPGLDLVKLRHHPAEYIARPSAVIHHGLFFPILAAVIASRICDMEHKGNTWKLLECNNQNRESIWLCKFTIVSTLMMLAIFIQAFTIIVYGNSVGIVQPLPVRTLLGFVLGTAMITFVVVTIQVFFSLVCANQLVPMSIGMVGALIGFITSHSCLYDRFLWLVYLYYFVQSNPGLNA